MTLTRTSGVPNATIDADLASEAGKLNDKLSKYGFLPVIALSAKYSF